MKKLTLMLLLFSMFLPMIACSKMEFSKAENPYLHDKAERPCKNPSEFPKARRKYCGFY